MDHFHLKVLVVAAFLALTCNADTDPIDNSIVLSNVERTVDISSHLPKITSKITVFNSGRATVRSFILGLDSNLAEYLTYQSASNKNGDREIKQRIVDQTLPNRIGKFYSVTLAPPLGAGREVVIDLETFYSHALQPYPSEIEQSEKQLVKMILNPYVISPYKVSSQKTTITCTSSNIESYTKTPKPVSVSEDTITYGPYENSEPFQEASVTVHYENNSPFLAVTEMTRLIEVSHWGNIAVEETYDIRHTGALLKGSFSRYDYQRQQDGLGSIKSFKTVLPASARDVYYRDEIGNISTSNLKELDDAVEIELRPRFPLFGGWKTHYTLGYNVPSYQYLYQDGDDYKLKMRFVDHVFDDQVIDLMKLRIVLPEGAIVQQMSTPYRVRRGDDETFATYLDAVGRPVVNANKEGLVDAHIQDFELTYKFSQTRMLQEPLMVVGAFYLLFLIVIIYVRLDFSITKDEATESRLRVAGLIEQIQGMQDRRSALYQSYDDAINKYKATKDAASFAAKRKQIDNDHKQLTTQITSLLSKLKAEGADAADKVNELQLLDNQVREQVNSAVGYAEKLIAGKMGKQPYLDAETTVRGKKDDCYSKMEAILASL